MGSTFQGINYWDRVFWKWLSKVFRLYCTCTCGTQPKETLWLRLLRLVNIYFFKDFDRLMITNRMLAHVYELCCKGRGCHLCANRKAVIRLHICTVWSAFPVCLHIWIMGNVYWQKRISDRLAKNVGGIWACHIRALFTRCHTYIDRDKSRLKTIRFKLVSIQVTCFSCAINVLLNSWYNFTSF